MYYNDEWGTVCSNGWDFNNAQVLCRQLGYGQWRSIVFVTAYLYGEGSGRIWLDNLKCSGNETTIGECSHAGWGIHDCGHDKDVGVQCLTTNSKSNVYFCTSYFSVYISMYEVVQFTCPTCILSCKWTHMV